MSDTESRTMIILKNLDALLMSIFSHAAKSGEWISTYAHRRNKVRLELFINFLFGDPNHCRDCYIKQLPILTDAVDIHEQFDRESA